MDMISQMKLELPIPMFLAPPLGMAIGWKREDGTRGLYIAVAFVSALMGLYSAIMQVTFHKWP